MLYFSFVCFVLGGVCYAECSRRRKLGRATGGFTFLGTGLFLVGVTVLKDYAPLRADFTDNLTHFSIALIILVLIGGIGGAFFYWMLRFHPNQPRVRRTY